MKEIQRKHANYSKTYLDEEAAKVYQQKFDRSLSSKVGAKWELRLTTQALQKAGEIIRQRGGKPLNKAIALDYPCGAGRLATMIASRTGGYVAGDQSPHMVNLAVQVLKDAELGDQLLGTTVGDIKECELEDGCVDVAFCMRLLHHFPEAEDRIQILKELRRVSVHALITTFHDADTIKQKRYVKKRNKQNRPCTRVIFTQEMFKNEAAQAGWDFVDSWQVSSVASGLCIALLQPL